MLTHNNHKLNSLRRILSIIGVILLIPIIAVSLSIFLVKIVKSDPTLFTTVEIQTKQANLPVRLEIPSIGLDAIIYYVGLTPNGAMDIKQNITQVAWYQPGIRPGDTGSAVIAGHYGWLAGEGAVFNNLHTLKKDDIITVIDDKGNQVVFTVRESRKYDLGANADDVFKSNDNKAHLNLITCDGDWIASKNTRSSRLVVFADKK